MAFNSFSEEESDRKFREFMKSEQFKASCNALRKFEQSEGGLSPEEVWNEVNILIDNLKTVDAKDRDTYVVHLIGHERRRVERIKRDEITLHRNGDQIRRSLTCIFYCLALRLAQACKDSSRHPHIELIDSIAKMLIDLNDPILPLLYKEINDEGDRREAASGHEIDEFDPLAPDEDWTVQVRKVVDHYGERIHKYVSKDMADEYFRIWNELFSDERIIQILRPNAKPLTCSEHETLGVDYNAKALFNILGLINKQGFFPFFKGADPFARAATEHYHPDTKKRVRAKKEYFTPDNLNIKPSYIGLKPDEIEYVKTILKGRKGC